MKEKIYMDENLFDLSVLQLGKCKPESDNNHIQERQQLFT